MTALHVLEMLNIIAWLANVGLFVWQLVDRRDNWFDTCDCAGDHGYGHETNCSTVGTQEE